MSLQVLQPPEKRQRFLCTSATTTASPEEPSNCNESLASDDSIASSAKIDRGGGGLGPIATTVYKRMASLVAEKHNHPYGSTLFWLRCKSEGRSACFQALVDLYRDNPEPSSEEARKCAKNCLQLETKYEKISFSDIIRQNYKQQEDDLVMLVTAFDLLLRYTTNLLKPKLPALWRTIPVTSGTFKARVDCMKGARDILKLIGYANQTETAVKFADEQLEPNRDKLVEIAAEILLAKVETEELIGKPHLLQRYLIMPQQSNVARATPPQSFTFSPAALTQLPPGCSATLPSVPSGSMQPVPKPRQKRPTVNQPPVNHPLVNQPPVNQTPVNQPSLNQLPLNQPPVSQPPVNQPSVNQPSVNQPSVNQPPVNQTSVNQTSVNQTSVNQTPDLSVHKKKLDEIRHRRQQLCELPQHPYTAPISKVEQSLVQASTQGDILIPTPPGRLHIDTPHGGLHSDTPPGQLHSATPSGGLPPRATPSGGLPPKATLEDANRVVEKYRKTHVINTLPYEPNSCMGSSGAAEGPGMRDGDKAAGMRDEGQNNLQDTESLNAATQNSAQTYEELKKAAKQKRKHIEPESEALKPEPVAPPHMSMTSEFGILRNQIKNAGLELLRWIMELTQEGYSPEEAHFMAKYISAGSVNVTLEWNKRVSAMQQWVEVETPLVGIPSRHEAITSVMNKMKPFMEVPWEAAKAALCDCDMNVEKAVWALQRDGLGLLYEFINSEQEWAKVKQSDMGEIKELLRGGGWTDNQSPLRLLVGECKFEDTDRANVVIQLMNELEQGGRGCELQFYIDAAKEHQTLEKAMNFLNVECPICTDHYTTHEMVLMPGCSHSVCKKCFEGHFTNVMMTQTVKHFNCPVCAQPDMSTRDADQDMYQELLVDMVKQLCTTEVADICSQKLRDHNLSTDPKFCWCANDKCHAGFANETGRDKIACPICKKEMCFKCKKPWEREHEGLTCDQFAQWKHDNDPQLQQQGLAAHLEANGIECPACHSRYDLARGGCMHFKCTQCPNEFCSGCGQAFKENQACKRFASCAKRGLHAHHPRDCLYFLRDFPMGNLQGFLEKNNVPFDKEPPKAQLEAAARESGGQAPQLRCSVLLQKETVDGLKDEACGKDAMEGCAGLCSVHYIEYLVTKINKTHLDPISLYDVHSLEAMLARDELPALEKKDDSEDAYKEKLIKHIQQVIPLAHVQQNAVAPPLQ
ncbi:hypothetical protein EMCRGX_G030823 [Ephydatia muelleri]